MDLRITLDTAVSRALYNIRNQTDQLGVVSEQASSGKRILQPEDDPVGSIALITYKSQDARLGNYLGNIQDATTTLNVGVSALLEGSHILDQARQAAIEGAHSSNDQNALNALGQQVDSLLNRLVAVANTQYGDRYIFGGTATKTQPFVLGGSGNAPRYVYKGASDRGNAIINQGQTVDTLYTGSEIFQSQQRAVTVYSGTTGAAPGTGTDSATGQGSLLVTHTSTTYAPGSGVQVGTNSAAGDTIIGPAGSHTLRIVDTSGTGTSGTISLDNGPPVAFTNTSTNLQVTGPGNSVVFLNTTAITPGFNGTVNATANGSLSVDNGVTSIPITFSGNQVVTNAATGDVTNVDSTNIRATGTAGLNYAGTYDAFQILQALRDDLRNTRGLPETQQLQSISNRIGELDRVRNNVLQVVGAQSADLQNLQGLQSHVQDIQLETRKLTADVEGADLGNVIVNLQADQNLLRLTLATTAKIFDQNLLDFLK